MTIILAIIWAVLIIAVAVLLVRIERNLTVINNLLIIQGKHALEIGNNILAMKIPFIPSMAALTGVEKECEAILGLGWQVLYKPTIEPGRIDIAYHFHLVTHGDISDYDHVITFHLDEHFNDKESRDEVLDFAREVAKKTQAQNFVP